jgi:hypothetical protein
MSEEHSAVLRYDEKKDAKGNLFWKPVYLRETPIEQIEWMNKTFTDWKVK